jgi:hypothetical protein
MPECSEQKLTDESLSYMLVKLLCSSLLLWSLGVDPALSSARKRQWRPPIVALNHKFMHRPYDKIPSPISLRRRLLILM